MIILQMYVTALKHVAIWSMWPTETHEYLKRVVEAYDQLKHMNIWTLNTWLKSMWLTEMHEYLKHMAVWIALLFQAHDW